ncbi:terminase large subunit [Salmonella phage 21]|nr:terminase large subunit [Salmonella phage 21]
MIHILHLFRKIQIQKSAKTEGKDYRILTWTTKTTPSVDVNPSGLEDARSQRCG